jgi:two-component system, cell cycle sensor histidine kinase and response regulator CckA
VEMEKMLRRTIGEDVELKTDLPSALWLTKVDPSQIEQVVMNLAVNARDAMPQGGTLAIETANVEFRIGDAVKPVELKPGRYVTLSVCDSGQGMDSTVISRVFEPFFTTKERGKGTGLGLAFVYGIVKQSNGHVSVISTLGRGTTFTIYLPSVNGDHQTSPEDQQRLHVARGKETVLLVEDEDSIRTLLGRILRANGYDVLEACNGNEALEVFQHADKAIELVVTDVVMPQMNGRVLIEHLRALCPGIQAIYMSGYTDDAIVRQGITESEVHFLRKPFRPAEIAAKMREVLDGG